MELDDGSSLVLGLKFKVGVDVIDDSAGHINYFNAAELILFWHF